MARIGSRVGLAAILILTASLAPAVAAPANSGLEPDLLHFPRPLALHPHVAFWKQVYTEFGVGDFVLHDRQNLALVYAVVRMDETRNAARAEAAAKPEIQRLRAMYEEILTRLAAGVTPEELGEEGRWVADAWGCPCPAELLLSAAANIRVQQGLRETVDEGMRRARGLLPRMLPILRRHAIPLELAALPLMESAFNPHARSKAGAVGLWQFIPSTGKRYLTINRRRDDRRDPILATEAAARLLRHNYEALGSWPLAILAYNHGRAGILAARDAVGSDAIEDIIAQYTGPRFGFASRNFYPGFLAALEVVHPMILEHSQAPSQPKPPARRSRRG